MMRFGQAVKFNTINNMSKIKMNQQIQQLKENQFLLFFEQHQNSMNMVNLTSYIRKYTDIMIQRKQLDNLGKMQHTVSVLQLIKKQVQDGQFRQHGDKQEDYRRAFAMQLSLCVEMLQMMRQQGNSKQVIIDHAKYAINQLKENNYISTMNQQEISLFLRCITQTKELMPNIQDEQEYWKIVESQIALWTPNTVSKALHSLSKFKSINEQVVKQLLDKICNAQSQQLNVKDILAIFPAIKLIGWKSTALLQEISQTAITIEDWLVKYCLQLTYKEVAIIFNCLSQIQCDPNQQFMEYIEKQVNMLSQVSLLTLAHIFQYYSMKSKQFNMSDQFKTVLLNYLQTVSLKKNEDTEQFTLFFNHYATYADQSTLQVILVALQSAPINDFSLAKIFQAITQLTFSERIIDEIVYFSVKTLQSYSKPINIHALNTIMRSSRVTNRKHLSEINQSVLNQLQKHHTAIFIEQFQQLLKAQQFYQLIEFLQVMVDFLKVFSEYYSHLTPEVRDSVMQIISAIDMVQDNELKGKLSRYVLVLEKYIQQ